MGRANTSSVDTDDGYKIAIQGQQNKIANQRNFSANGDNKENANIVNSNKAKMKNTTAAAKAKAKAKKAKSKASRKANKKK